MKTPGDDELIERVLSLLDAGRCSNDGCVQGAYPSTRDGEPVPCMWHDERAVVSRLLHQRFPQKAPAEYCSCAEPAPDCGEPPGGPLQCATCGLDFECQRSHPHENMNIQCRRITEAIRSAQNGVAKYE